MAHSNAERQRRHRAKVRATSSRVDLKLPFQIAIKLDYLAQHWQCTKTEALGRMLLDTWEREGNPIPGYDAEVESLHGNDSHGSALDND